MPPDSSQWWSAGTQALGVLLSLVTGIGAYIAAARTTAKAEGAIDEKIKSLGDRLNEVEGEVKGVSKVEKDVAVLSEQVKGFRELVGRDVEELKHTSRNIRQSIDTLGKQITDLVSRPH